MKKVLLIFLLLFILFSCESKRKKCWNCTTRIDFYGSAFKDTLSYPSFTNAYEFKKCDMSRKEIREFEKHLTGIQFYNDHYEAAISITECEEKK